MQPGPGPGAAHPGVHPQAPGQSQVRAHRLQAPAAGPKMRAQYIWPM